MELARALPPNACDTHVHVFDPQRFPYTAARSYTPGAATVDALRRMQDELGLRRVVLVQPSVYGFDNRCLLDAIAQLGKDRARGIAVVDVTSTTRADLATLHAGGVRGLRVNLEVRAEHSAAAARDEIDATASLVRQMAGWSLQIHAGIHVLAAAAPQLEQLGVPVVLDHHAGLRDAASEGGALDRLEALMLAAPVYLKLSAPYKLRPGDVSPSAIGARFCATAPKRVLWGSDWPHTGGGTALRSDPQAIEPFRCIDNAQVLAELAGAVSSPRAREQLMVENAARLYGFVP